MAISRLQMSARTKIFSGQCVAVEVCIPIHQYLTNIFNRNSHISYLGTFGVNTRVWLKTYPALAAINTATGAVVCSDRSSYEKMVSTLMDLQKPLREAGYTVCSIPSPLSLPIISILIPSLTPHSPGPLGNLRRTTRPNPRLHCQIRRRLQDRIRKHHLRRLRTPRHHPRLQIYHPSQTVHRKIVLERRIPGRVLARR
jgi:hypothetical protein